MMSDAFLLDQNGRPFACVAGDTAVFEHVPGKRARRVYVAGAVRHDFEHVYGLMPAGISFARKHRSKPVPTGDRFADSIYLITGLTRHIVHDRSFSSVDPIDELATVDDVAPTYAFEVQRPNVLGGRVRRLKGVWYLGNHRLHLEWCNARDVVTERQITCAGDHAVRQLRQWVESHLAYGFDQALPAPALPPAWVSYGTRHRIGQAPLHPHGHDGLLGAWF